MATENEICGVLAAAGFELGDDPLREREDVHVRRNGDRVTVALGDDLVGTSPANGGNVAGAIVAVLTAAGFSVEPSGWEHLLAGEESTVERVAYTTRQLAQRLYGTETPSRAQVTSAGQWAARQPGLEPANPGFRPLLWPVGPADAALAARAEMLAAGKVNPGNRETGDRKAAAARAGHAARQDRSARTGDAT